MLFSLAIMSGPLNSVLLNVLIQLCIIVAAARVFSWLAKRVGQPGVVGEITAGLLLGPSFFGAIAPEASHLVFDPATEGIFKILSQIGLIFLLFLIGLEFDFHHLRRDIRGTIGLSIAGLIIPFALGWGLALFMATQIPPAMLDPLFSAAQPTTGPARPNHSLLLGLFMGTAMSITAIPVLGRIMLELNITRSKIGAMTITASAVEDAAGWILLAAVSSLAHTSFELSETLKMMGLTVVFALAMVFVVRPLVSKWWLWVIRNARREEQSQGLIDAPDGGEKSAENAVKAVGYDAVAIALVVLLLCAICTHLIGISAIFGAFMFGAVMSATPSFHEAMRDKLMMFVTVFFLPIFFTYTGLRTDVGSITGSTMWLFAGLVLFCAMVGKLGGCAAAARIAGLSWRESACVGVMMNTRGLMELVVATVGLELRIIPTSVFCMLVIMALVTSVMTTPLLIWLSKGTELEPLIARSEMMRRRG